jgi:hypothetical protein
MRDRTKGFARAALERSFSPANRLGALAALTGAAPRNHRRALGDDGRDSAAVIVCAREIVADLRGILRRLPGATGISFQPFEAWASLYVTVPTDEAVDTLGRALGLGASEHRGSEGRWWCRAASPHDLGITVIGPLHTEVPPARDDSGESSP